MNHPAPGLLRLILWPSIFTLLVNIGRLLGQRQGWITTQSGGGGSWLGITWLGFLLGIWFARRLAQAGSAPRVPRPWLWSLLSVLPIVAAAAWRMPGVLAAEADDAGLATMRATAFTFAAASGVAASVQFVVWPRLACTLLAYAIPARLTVIALTWLAKHNAWDSHYTKMGPKGFQRDMEGTMASATIMQLGFWVPITIVFGTLLGCVFFGRRRASP